MTPADLQVLKHAQKELIALCGGLTLVAVLTNYGRSTVGRWADVGDPSPMPTPAIITLEKHCKVPVMSAAMALIAEQRRLADADDALPEKCLLTALADVFAAGGDLGATFAAAIADGKLTPNELTALSERLAALSRALSEAVPANSAARAHGGLKVVG